MPRPKHYTSLKKIDAASYECKHSWTRQVTLVMVPLYGVLDELIPAIPDKQQLNFS